MCVSGSWSRCRTAAQDPPSAAGIRGTVGLGVVTVTGSTARKLGSGGRPGLFAQRPAQRGMSLQKMCAEAFHVCPSSRAPEIQPVGHQSGAGRGVSLSTIFGAKIWGPGPRTVCDVLLGAGSPRLVDQQTDGDYWRAACVQSLVFASLLR